jgi:hypothetical protein
MVILMCNINEILVITIVIVIMKSSNIMKIIARK